MQKLFNSIIHKRNVNTTTTCFGRSSSLSNTGRTFSKLFRSHLHVNQLLTQIKDEYKTLPRDDLLLDGRKTKIYGFIKTSSLENSAIMEKPDFSKFCSSSPKLMILEEKTSNYRNHKDIVALHYRVEKDKMFSNELFAEYLLFKKPLYFIFQRNLADDSTRELIQIDLSDRSLAGDLKLLKQDELLTILQRERTIQLPSKCLTPIIDSIQDFAKENDMKLVCNDSNFHHHHHNGKIIIKESVVRNDDLLMLMGQTNRVINYDEFTCSLISAFSEETLMKNILKLYK